MILSPLHVQYFTTIVEIPIDKHQRFLGASGVAASLRASLRAGRQAYQHDIV